MVNFNKQLILGSKSPRRARILRDAGFKFSVESRPVKETFPKKLEAREVAAYLSRKKAEEFLPDIREKVAITADTVVLLDNQIMGKPRDVYEARFMLKMLSGKPHQVITGVSLCNKSDLITFDDNTQVTFRDLTEEEINHYIKQYKPFDKAGAYGIQEWIGLIGIKHISGSYFTVMGLPIHKVYENLPRMI